MKKTQNTNTKTTNTATAKTVELSNAESVQTSKKAESKKADSVKAESKKAESVKIETLYSNMKAVIDLTRFNNAEQLACNELNYNEFVINQVVDNSLIALAKIYAHKNRYDLLLNKSRLTVLFANALKANELLNVDFNAKKLETKKQYVVELNLQQLEQYIVILFDLTKKQDDNKQ